MPRFRPTIAGFFGKLPARGDFVRTGLPETIVEPLDQWCKSCLIASRAALQEDWTQAWMTAPIWRFLLPPGACGPDPLLGVWMPSIDKAGRPYPFILAASASEAELQTGGEWLRLAEEEGLAGVVDDRPHDAIAAALQAETPRLKLPFIGWWTEGSKQVQPQWIEHAGLLPPETHAGAMLRDPVAVTP